MNHVLISFIKTAAAEFAPGLPVKEKISSLPSIASPKKWEFVLQKHEADKAGTHYDLRLGDTDTGIGHSWALPSGLPPTGGRGLAIQQPDHTISYFDFQGRITDGYGKGNVSTTKRTKTEIVSAGADKVSFNLYTGRDIEEYTLVRTNGKNWIIVNRGVTKERRPDLPSSKPMYRETKFKMVKFDDTNQLMAAKLDGAHVTLDMSRSGGPVRLFSYRPTERATGVIEHTHKVKGTLNTRVPSGLGGTVLRGELWGVRKGTKKSAIPAEELGGILNSGVWKSRDKQEDQGVNLAYAPFDVVKYRGRNVDNYPYQKKLTILKDVVNRLKEVGSPMQIGMPRFATTEAAKAKLYRRIKNQTLPETKEGVILWNLTDSAPPVKAKLRPDHDVFIRRIFMEKGERGKLNNMAGGFEYSWTPDGPIMGRVGTGFSHELKRDMAANPQVYIDRVAKVEAEKVFKSSKYPSQPGALSKPAFIGWHIEKGKQK